MPVPRTEYQEVCKDQARLRRAINAVLKVGFFVAHDGRHYVPAKQYEAMQRAYEKSTFKPEPGKHWPQMRAAFRKRS